MHQSWIQINHFNFALHKTNITIYLFVCLMLCWFSPSVLTQEKFLSKGYTSTCSWNSHLLHKHLSTVMTSIRKTASSSRRTSWWQLAMGCTLQSTLLKKPCSTPPVGNYLREMVLNTTNTLWMGIIYARWFWIQLIRYALQVSVALNQSRIHTCVPTAVNSILE